MTYDPNNPPSAYELSLVRPRIGPSPLEEVVARDMRAVRATLNRFDAGVPAGYKSRAARRAMARARR